MRNLKRVLSLALASVMLIGMMAIGAGAADYNDSKDISYEEAAAVMSAIGVFQGDNNGYFNPKGDLTREAAAKIITYMLMGKDAADGLATSKAPFTDVAANRWSAGSIAYCVQNGIVAGDGQGNFFPEAVVTGSQFGKMLLGALGYQAEAEGLVGSGWEINVAKLVKLAKLNKSLNVTLSRTMTREQAAQMAFNALNANLVEYQGGTKVTTPDGTVVNVGGVRYPLVELFRESNFSTLKRSDATNETFGRPGNTWKFGNKTVGTYSATPEFVYTAKTEEKVVKADLTGFGLPASNSIDVVKNGKGNSDTTIIVSANIIPAVTALTQNGTAVEVYTTGDTITDVVVIETELVTISSINTVTKTVYFKGIANSVKSDDAEEIYDELVSMGKDAEVLVNLAKNGDVLAVAEPETVEGTYTAISKDNKEITVDGDKYKFSVKHGITISSLKLGSNYTLFLDAHGYVIGAEEEEAAATKLGYVLNAEREGSSKAGYTYVARIVFADGTQNWVDVSKVDTDNTADLTESEFKTAVENKAVKYSEKSDGTYNLAVVVANESPTRDGVVEFTTVATTKEYKITKNEVNFFSMTAGSDAAATAIMGNGKTVFLVYNASSKTYSSYTGVKNVPTMEDVDAKVVLLKDTKVASLVVVTKNASSVSNDSLAYVVGLIKSEYDTELKAPVYFYEAIVKGAITTLKYTEDTAVPSGLYTVGYDSKDYAVSLTAVDGDDNDFVVNAGGAKISSGIVTLEGTTIPVAATKNYVSTENFKVFVIDLDGEVSEIDSANLKDYALSSATLILDSTKKFAETLVVTERALYTTKALTAATVTETISDASVTVSTATINETAKTVTVTVTLNGGTLVNGETIVVTASTHTGASVSGSPVTLTYNGTTWSTGTITVTAEDGSAQAYAVSAS